MYFNGAPVFFLFFFFFHHYIMFNVSALSCIVVVYKYV